MTFGDRNLFSRVFSIFLKSWKKYLELFLSPFQVPTPDSDWTLQGQQARSVGIEEPVTSLTECTISSAGLLFLQLCFLVPSADVSPAHASLVSLLSAHLSSSTSREMTRNIITHMLASNVSSTDYGNLNATLMRVLRLLRRLWKVYASCSLIIQSGYDGYVSLWLSIACIT